MSQLWEALQDPSAEYTPMPFWFWNDELSQEEILRQMREMKDKGVDGFVIHPRKGLPRSIAYLSKTYFRYVRFAVEKAKEMEMKVVLYDEAMYPSGSCHGEVVKANPEYASKGLMKLAGGNVPEGGTLIADGYAMVESGGTIRGVHEEEDDGEAFAPKSVDLLNPAAVAKFIELTHEKYYSELSEAFGDTIIAFFTDEPNILGRCAKAGIIPWSAGIYEEYLAAGGRAEDLWQLFELPDEKHAGAGAREIYRKVIHERMSKSYYAQLSAWCLAHHIALTGHPEKSTDIGYLQYFQIPCQDIVWRFVEPEDGHAICGEHSTMGKCSSDSARHRGRRRNGNECFGCCGERQDPKKFTSDDMRWYLNWLFVRGVNLVYPHAFYYSVREDRGDERPPEVGMHNPFWPQYRKLSTFIKRMCYLNTDAVNQAQVAILCGEEDLSWELAKPLFTHQIEFNYLERALLQACRIGDRELQIAQQGYRVIVSDRATYEMLDDEQKAVLAEFTKAGGCLILGAADEAAYVSGIQSNIAPAVTFSGECEQLRVSHLKKDGEDVLILCNEGMETIHIEVKESGDAERFTTLWNPYTEETIPLTKADQNVAIAPNDLWLAV
ncbi:MAG: hypothetical protein K6G23_09705 [Lachnospiraceae bacterium]|nr:hypothetical protein [Lachnospiraceae bacterium]